MCPGCKHKNFKKSAETPRPYIVYKTDRFPNFVRRYKICLMCGKKYITVEKFEREVEDQSSVQGKLF